jgi:uncharacterized protein (DUF486 family)
MIRKQALIVSSSTVIGPGVLVSCQSLSIRPPEALKKFRATLMRFAPIVLLIFSNLFMTYAWYGHLKDLRAKPLLIVIVISWGIAFFEYCLQVPANRLGSSFFTLAQLKVLQEVLAMIVFAGFCVFYMKQRLSWDYLWASLCLAGAAFFMFRHLPPGN